MMLLPLPPNFQFSRQKNNKKLGYTYYNLSNIQLRQLHGLHLQTAVIIYPG